MTKSKQSKKGSGPGKQLKAAALGAAVGAIAVVFTDKNIRNKIKNKALEIAQKGEEKLQEIETKLEKAEKQGRKELVAKLEKVKKQLEKKA